MLGWFKKKEPIVITIQVYQEGKNNPILNYSKPANTEKQTKKVCLELEKHFTKMMDLFIMERFRDKHGLCNECELLYKLLKEKDQ